MDYKAINILGGGRIMRCVVSNTYRIKEVMESFEENHERVVCVLNKNKIILGVVSQGDIIRALAGDIDIYANIMQIIQPSFLYLHKRDMKEAYKIFKEKKITLLPIVSDEFRLIDMITSDDIYQYLEDK